MLILDINNNDKGQLYTHKSTLSNGLFLNIKHTLCNKLSMLTKQINFTHVSFNRAGDRFIACDLHGSIYMFDLNYNRFMRLNRLGITCTALAFNLKCKTEYLVACIDGTIKCFNAETRDLVGWMKGHEKPIISLSVHPTNDVVISFSTDLAQLWCLKTFQCKQKLSINSKKNVEIVKICFAPGTSDIVSVFKDDSIYVWSGETISLKCQFNSNQLQEAKNEQQQPAVGKHFYRCLSVSSDGKTLVTGSRFNYLHVWSIESKQLVRTINLSDPSLVIKDCCIIPGFCYDNKLLLILCTDGTLDVYNIETGCLVANLNSKNLVHNQSQVLDEQKISQIRCSSNGRFMCAVTHDGFIQCFDLDSSQLKAMKATSGLMKSSINSTANATAHRQISKPGNETTQRFKQKQNVSKRTQNLLDNPQIYPKLNRILKCYNEYPARYRMFIWKMLLKLPENYDSYASLVERGSHPAYVDLPKKYPVKSQKCIRMLERTLSALAHWSPIFSECDYLPLLVFPFVKLFQNNQVICFEVCATLISNWCNCWFEFFPNPPMNILNMIENLLGYHDRNLLEHFMRYRINCQIYGWSLMETIFSEVFNKNDWQILFDNLFSNHPGFLLYLVVSYSICNRTALLQVKELDDAKFFFRHRNPLGVHHLIQEANKMTKTTPVDIDPCRLLNRFEPLTKGTYPVFNKRPRFISDYQLTEKSKILQEEMDYLKERELHLESHKQNENRKIESEFMLKKMFYDNNRMYKESVEEYERKQKTIEEMNRLKLLSSQQGLKVSVAGEPAFQKDLRGNILYNKMRQIDENFDDIQNMLLKARKKDTTDEIEMSLNDEDFKEIEKEVVANRAKALQSADDQSDKNGNELNQSEALSAISVSTILSLDRGREGIENQERDTLKRIYDLRKNLAIENRKKHSVKSILAV